MSQSAGTCFAAVFHLQQTLLIAGITPALPAGADHCCLAAGGGGYLGDRHADCARHYRLPTMPQL